MTLFNLSAKQASLLRAASSFQLGPYCLLCSVLSVADSITSFKQLKGKNCPQGQS